MASILPSSYKKTYQHYVKLFSIIGLGFDDSVGYFTKSNLKLIVFNIFFIPFGISQFSLLSKFNADNFFEEKNQQVVPIVVMLIVDTVKLVTTIRKRSEMRHIFEELGQLWPRDNNIHKTIILNSWLRRMKLLLNSFFIFALANTITFELYPFLITCYNLLFGTNEYVLPFDISGLQVNSLAVYIIAYVLEVFGTAPCQLFLYMPYDFLIVTSTSNVSLLLRLLQVDLENVINSRNGTENTLQNNLECYERIKEIISKHQRILRIANKLNEVFGLVIFFHVSLSAIVICFFGFLTVAYGGLIETITNFITALNLIITVFLISLAGQLLLDTSSNIADAAYKSLWYESDVKIRKLMLFIMTRSQKPSYLSALGYTNMTLQGFSKIMSTTWTYLSILIQLYQDK